MWVSCFWTSGSSYPGVLLQPALVQPAPKSYIHFRGKSTANDHHEEALCTAGLVLVDLLSQGLRPLWTGNPPSAKPELTSEIHNLS